MEFFFQKMACGFGFAAYVIAEVIYDIRTEILFLKCSSQEPIKNRTPENGKHMYQYLRVESFLGQLLEFSKVPCASSYGHFIARKEFWSQCHILLFCNAFEIIICNF